MMRTFLLTGLFSGFIFLQVPSEFEILKSINGLSMVSILVFLLYHLFSFYKKTVSDFYNREIEKEKNHNENLQRAYAQVAENQKALMEMMLSLSDAIKSIANNLVK